MSSKKLISVSFLAAAAIAINTAPTWGQTRGGTQSERTPESGTPLPQGSQSSGTEDPSKAGRPGSTSQPPSGTGQSNKDSSIGGSQSKRAGDSDTPVPQGRFSGQGATEKESGSASQPSGAAQRNRNKDTSIGGSQSKRAGDSDTPVTQGRFGDSGTAGQSSRNVSESHRVGGQHDVRQAQEALKNQGHDPGPIDGVMGPQTRQALRAFQSSNGLKQTGMLDAETKQKLNINDSSARGTKPIGEGSTRQKESSPMGK
jgi:Putative peptidoglycan binding domain